MGDWEAVEDAKAALGRDASDESDPMFASPAESRDEMASGVVLTLVVSGKGYSNRGRSIAKGVPMI